MSTFLLAAGGTGGHLFPAEALAHELVARRHAVHLATDERADRFSANFPGTIHIVPSATFGSKNPAALAKSAFTLWRGLRASKRLLRKLRPAAVMGFGGYPTLPPLFAATGSFPTAIHEANGVMGRANKLLAPRVDAIAGGFLTIEGPHAAKMERTGNPVRQAVRDAAKKPYEASSDTSFNLLVFGGSQGAAYFSNVVPEAVEQLEPSLRAHLRIVQQARSEDMQAVRDAYARLAIEATVEPFFDDLPSRIADAHLVISRSGASTVSELATIGRPSILVPYPFALDHDQAANAAGLEQEGGATLVPQSELTAERLATMLGAAMVEPDRMADMATAAQNVGHGDATKRLADLIERIAAKR